MKSLAKLFATLLILTVLWVPAVAQATAPNMSCYVTVTLGSDGLLHVHFPGVVQNTATSSPGVLPTIYSADLVQTSPGSMSFQLQYAGLATTPIVDNCQAQQLYTNSTGAWSAFVPQGIYGSTPFSAFLNQTAVNSSTFMAMPGAAMPLGGIPSGQVKCVGITHFSDHSVINPVIYKLVNVDSGAKRAVVWTSSNGLPPQGGGFSYGTVNPSGSLDSGLTLTAAGQSYVINTFGTYSGTFAVTTALGTATVLWSVTVGSSEVACSVNPS